MERCEEILGLLLSIEDRFNTKDFEKMRLDAMVAVVCIIPQPSVSYLTKQFGTNKYSIQHRFEILQVISASAKALSEGISNVCFSCTN